MSDSPFDPPGGPLEGGPIFGEVEVSGCRRPHGDMQIEGRRLWGQNKCHNSLWGVDIRKPENFNGAEPYYARQSYMEPRSESPIRAKQRQDVAPYGEPCSFHYGHVHIGNDSYMRMQFCSDNLHEGQMRRSTIATMHVKAADTPGRQPPSYMMWAGAYEVVPFTEIHYNGPARICSLPI